MLPAWPRSERLVLKKRKSSTKSSTPRTKPMRIKNQIPPDQTLQRPRTKSFIAALIETLTRQQGLRARPRYKNHRVVDDAQGIVTALKTTTGIVNEARELMDLIDQHQANAGVAAKTIIADCKYGTVENYIACQNRKLRTHMADLLASSAGSGRRDEIYPESQFLYRAQSDTYLCPAGQAMRPRRLHPVRLSWEYVTKRGVCLSCQLREFCTRSKTGRSIKRHRDQALLDRARRQANTREPSLIANAGSILVERSFADAANRHGFKRARWRGLVKQSIPDLVIATVQNLRKLVATTQNLSGKAWEAISRILSWSAGTLHTLFTSSPPRHLVLALS